MTRANCPPARTNQVGRWGSGVWCLVAFSLAVKPLLYKAFISLCKPRVMILIFGDPDRDHRPREPDTERTPGRRSKITQYPRNEAPRSRGLARGWLLPWVRGTPLASVSIASSRPIIWLDVGFCFPILQTSCCWRSTRCVARRAWPTEQHP